jgi:type I restriction enzyme M protein
LLFFKRICDVYDEEFAEALNESGGDPSGARWADVRKKPENIGLGLQNAMRAIEMANPDTLLL